MDSLAKRIASRGWCTLLKLTLHVAAVAGICSASCRGANAQPFFAPALYSPGGLKPVCVVTNITGSAFPREPRNGGYGPPQVSIQIYDADGHPMSIGTDCPMGGDTAGLAGLLSHASCKAWVTLESEEESFPSGVFFCRVNNPGRGKVRIVMMLVDPNTGRIATATASRRDEGTK